MVDVTLIRPLNKGQGHSFWYHRFLIYNFLQARNSNFCSRTHRLATILHVTDDDDRQTDIRSTVPIARPLVRSAKNAGKVNKLVMNDRRLSVDFIAESVDISTSNAYSILTENLFIESLCAISDVQNAFRQSCQFV